MKLKSRIAEWAFNFLTVPPTPEDLGRIQEYLRKKGTAQSYRAGINKIMGRTGAEEEVKSLGELPMRELWEILEKIDRAEAVSASYREGIRKVCRAGLPH